MLFEIPNANYCIFLNNFSLLLFILLRYFLYFIKTHFGNLITCSLFTLRSMILIRLHWCTDLINQFMFLKLAEVSYSMIANWLISLHLKFGTFETLQLLYCAHSHSQKSFFDGAIGKSQFLFLFRIALLLKTYLSMVEKGFVCLFTADCFPFRG